MGTLIDVIEKKYTTGGALNIISNVLSTPQHLATAGIAEGDFLQNFAKGINPSDFLPSDTHGALKFGVMLSLTH